jgi:catechol 2,3-dioxygenase-like lactoylglutathione lyase family enzyme
MQNYRICPQVAVSDMRRARQFYEETLGLEPTAGPNEQNVVYTCAGGTALYVYAAPNHAGRATGTVARWDVDDIERVVDQLTARGVTFERFAEPVKTDAKGIHDSGYGKVAWFKDPDGNTFAIELAAT